MVYAAHPTSARHTTATFRANLSDEMRQAPNARPRALTSLPSIRIRIQLAVCCRFVEPGHRTPQAKTTAGTATSDPREGILTIAALQDEPPSPTTATGYRQLTHTFRGGTEQVLAEAAALPGLEFTRFAGTPLARVRTVELGGFLTTILQTTPVTMRWRREQANARRRTLLLAVRSGQLRTTLSDAEQRVVDAGAALLVPPGAQDLEFESAATSSVLMFSFDHFDAPLSDGVDRQVRLLDSAALTTQTAIAYLEALASARAAATRTEARTLAAVSREIARSLTSALDEQPEPDQESSLVARSRTILEQRFPAHTLTPEDVAEALGVSRRTLGRAWTAHGMKMSQELRRIRVREAQLLISGSPQLTRTEVAKATGFGSAETLRRALLTHGEQ